MTYKTWYIPKGVEFRVKVLDVKWLRPSDSESQASERNECSMQLVTCNSGKGTRGNTNQKDQTSYKGTQDYRGTHPMTHNIPEAFLTI